MYVCMYVCMYEYIHTYNFKKPAPQAQIPVVARGLALAGEPCAPSSVRGGAPEDPSSRPAGTQPGGAKPRETAHAARGMRMAPTDGVRSRPAPGIRTPAPLRHPEQRPCGDLHSAPFTNELRPLPTSEEHSSSEGQRAISFFPAG